MAGKRNRRSPINSNYYNNNHKKRFDYTMNKLYKVIEDQENTKVNTEFFAKIISGNETGDTTFFGVNIFNTSFFNPGDPIVYNIRFLEPYLEYNYGLTDPLFIGDENERNLIIQNHPEAFYLENSFFSSPPVVGARVLVTDKNNDGIYRIERLLEENEGPVDDMLQLTPEQQASLVFLNPKSPFAFMNDFINTPKGDWTMGSGVRFRNTQEEKRATQFLNELVKKTSPYNIPVHVNSAYRSPADQARVVAGNTARENGRNLSVYGDTTKAIYLKYGRAAHANPKGPEMKKLIDYETRKLANALKKDPNYHGHGTGYAFDLRIRGLNSKQLKIYKDLIESLGAKVLYEKHPPHYHIWLKNWVPKEQSLVDKGLELMSNLTDSFKEDSE